MRRRASFAEVMRARFAEERAPPRKRAFQRGWMVDPAKKHARNAVAAALRNGLITREPCEVCDDPKVEAHHDDYSRPLDVRWRCRRHHDVIHGR